MTTDMPLVARVRKRREALARTTLALIVETIPVYGRLPAEQLAGEILTIVRTAVTLLLETIGTGDEPSEPTMAALRASAVRRAEERVPLSAILGAYHAGADVLWDALVTEADDGEHAQIIHAGGRLLGLIQVLTVEVSSAYLDEHRAIHSEERQADRERLELLLRDGQRPDGWPDDADIALIEVRYGRTSDEEDPGVEGAVAARRKVRRIEEWLHEVPSRPAAVVTEDRATIAIAVDDVAETARMLHDGLREAGSVEVLLAAVRVEDEGPAHARRGSVLLADLAERAGWRDRTVVVDDMLVPYLVARVPEVRRRAREARARLADGPDLLETLAAWFAHDFDRRATANALHVHPNTLDHRLHRISERLGADLSTAAGVELASMVKAVDLA
jgi:hypothetical protein